MTTDVAPEADDLSTEGDSVVRMIPVDQIVGNPNNPRRTFVTSGPDWNLFVDSIKEIGIQQPVLVRPMHVHEPDAQVALPARYEMVAGHRRLAGVIAAQRGAIPAIVRDLTDEQALVIMLVENLQRVDLDPVEEASGYFRLVECGMTQADMAEKVGRSKKHVSERLQLLKAPAKVLALVKKGQFPIGDALEYAKIEDPEVIEVAITKFLETSRDPEWALMRAKDEVSENRVTDEVVRDLAERKIRTIVASSYGHSPQFLKEQNVVPLTDLGMKNSPKGHEDKPWLVAVVRRGSKSITWCTDDRKAARQYAPRVAEPESEKAAKEADRAKKREAREAQEADDARLVLAAKSKVSLSDLVVEGAELIISLMHDETAKRLCKMLELEHAKEYGAAKKALREHVSAKVLIHLVHGYDLQRGYSPETKAAYAEFLAQIEEVNKG